MRYKTAYLDPHAYVNSYGADKAPTNKKERETIFVAGKTIGGNASPRFEEANSPQIAIALFALPLCVAHSTKTGYLLFKYFWSTPIILVFGFHFAQAKPIRKKIL